VTQIFRGTRGRGDTDTILADVKVGIGYPRTWYLRTSVPEDILNIKSVWYGVPDVNSIIVSYPRTLVPSKLVSGTQGYRSPIPTLISYRIVINFYRSPNIPGLGKNELSLVCRETNYPLAIRAKTFASERI
jgi:hypothetical protein